MAKDWPTEAWATNKRSTSSAWLFSALATADCSTFFTSWATRRREKLTWPTPRATSLLLRSCRSARVARADDVFVGALVLARAVALGRLAPGGDRMATAAGAAAMRMVDRVLRLAADMAQPALPAIAPGLADLLV